MYHQYCNVFIDLRCSHHMRFSFQVASHSSRGAFEGTSPTRVGVAEIVPSTNTIGISANTVA